MKKLISQQSVKVGGCLTVSLVRYRSFDCNLDCLNYLAWNIFLWILLWIIFLFYRRILFCETFLLCEKDYVCLERQVKSTNNILLTLYSFMSNPYS